MRRERAAGAARRRRPAIAAVAIALVFAAAGCGDDDAPASDAAERRAAARGLAALQRSFAAGDRQRLCAQMGTTAVRQAGVVAHGQVDECPRDLSEAFDVIAAGGGFRGVRDSVVVATEVDGERARTTLDLDDHGEVGVPLVRESGTWRLATFFGTPPREAERAAASAATAPFPPAARRVAVADGTGSPCFPLFDDDYPDVSGGCALGAAGRVTLTIGTAFGHFEFGRCELSYRVLIDDSGRSWTDSVDLSGPDNVNNGCTDVDACENADGDPLPWRGRVSATPDGRVVHRMNACLDTCIGFYAGPLTIGISKDRGWRALAERAAVGDSGLRFDGRLALLPRGLRLTPAPR